jgi:hypothetical protein
MYCDIILVIKREELLFTYDAVTEMMCLSDFVKVDAMCSQVHIKNKNSSIQPSSAHPLQAKNLTDTNYSTGN